MPHRARTEQLVSQKKQSYGNGELIFREGEAGDTAYVITRGQVALSKETAQGPVEIETLGPGDYFGEIGVLNGGQRTLSAIAVGKAEISQVSRDDYKKNRQQTAERLKSDTLTSRVEGTPDTGKGWFSRLLGKNNRDHEQIDVRIVALAGENGDAHTRTLSNALLQCPGIKVRVINPEGVFTHNSLAPSQIGPCVGEGRKILRSSGGDLLIWGNIAATGETLHLHFVSAVPNDEDVAGALNGYDMLPLPTQIDESWTALLHAVAITATVPVTQAKIKTLNEHIAAATELGAPIAQTPPRSFNPTERANLLMCLGHCLSTASQRLEEPELLSIAAETYGRASELITLDDSALIWGMAHKHLGNTLWLMSERGGGVNALRDAGRALRTATESIPRRNLPREWAAAQNKLGQTLYKLDLADAMPDTDLLRSAITAFQASMQVYTRVDAPERWADVMHNSAQATLVLGEQMHAPDALQRAVHACRSALEVRQRERTPFMWAATQNTLGSALFLLGKMSYRPDHLEAASDAFEAARAVYQSNGAHKMVQVIGRNLEHVHGLLGHPTAAGEVDTEWLDKDVVAEFDANWWRENVVDDAPKQVNSH